MTNFLEQKTSPRVTSVISTISLLFFLPFLVFGLYEAYSALRAFGTPANIVVNTEVKLEPIRTDYLHAFAQGGEEATDMIGPIIPEVKALHPRLIRVDHIYDYYQVVSRSGNDLTFNWSKLDTYVSSILATGAKPVLALSYMPAAIAQGGNIVNPPNNWNDWALVVQKTIEHFSGKNDRNIAGMYYEVWNEPDHPQFGGWKLSGEKNYLTLYSTAAQGANSAQNVNPFSLGGPGTTGLYKAWIQGIIATGARLDFLSWHSYLSDPRQYAQDQHDLAGWLSITPQYALLPKLITEFGFTGAKDARYETMFAAAHVADVFRNTASGGPTYLFSFELKDAPNQSNGWGLLTNEKNGKTPKPRYSVYNFLDSMAGNRLESDGEGTWVSALATTNNGVIRLMLVNFNAESSRSENVPVTFTKLIPGTYQYREHLLLDRDVKFTDAVGDDGKLTKEVFMPGNSVAILELTRTGDATPSAEISPTPLTP